ncbi:hypothetical protein CDL12_02178 [Handroanthus impetiginosus]|uniref:Uncharacterized protein n=1 Tax=Handroanthus impetiginosus TaxID=429701 RepID=A0A2G9I5P5_9LAMI|nr:hypothetical protein CDL12_02178 [Handroanthus impetiginosus]
MKFNARIKKLFACNVTQRDDPSPINLDVREEYANAFRTESYHDFWTHVLALNKGHLTTHRSLGSTTAARLPSYRLFAEHLLDPDQSTVTRILGLTQTHSKILSPLTNYFSSTSDASHLCGLLLKDIERMRKRHKFLKDPFDSPENGSSPQINQLPVVLARITLFSKSNPFCGSAPSMNRFQAVQDSCSNLLKQLESRRDKTQSKIRRLKKLRCGLAVFLVAITASLLVIVVAHAFVLLVAAPAVMPASLEMISMDKLTQWSAQLDASAKGTYILIRDLDTISRLVARLNNELEHVEALVQMWLERKDDRLQASEEVACQLKKSNQNFIEQLDELEEHLYLCFMTINRARNLVIKEILNSTGTSTLNSPNPLAK